MRHNILRILAIGMISLAIGSMAVSCKDYQSDIDQDNETTARLDSVYNDLNGSVSLLTQRLEYAQTEARKSHDKLAEAIESLKDLQKANLASKEYVDAQDSVIRAAAEAAAADAKVEAVKEAKDYADELLTQAKNLMSSNYVDKTSYEKAIGSLTQQINGLNAKITALTSDITDLQDNDKSLQNQIDAAEEKIGILQNTCDKYGETLNDLEGLVDDLDSLKNITDSLKNYLEQVKSIIDNSGNTEELLTALQEVKDQVTAVLGDIDTLKGFVVKNLKSIDLVPEYFDAAAPGGYVICYEAGTDPTESEETEVTWEVNPVGANLQGAKYEIVHRTVKTRAASEDDTNIANDLTVEINEDTSRIVTKFKVNINDLQSVDNSKIYDLIALKVTIPVYDSDEKQVVKSPYYAIMSKASLTLKTPENDMSINYHAIADKFPCKFTWTTLSDYDDYVLKVSLDDNFEADKTICDTIKNGAEYDMPAEELMNFINSFDRSRTMHFYWTVVPLGTKDNKTEVREITILCPPTLIGEWLFNDESNLCKATVGKDLILNNGTLTVSQETGQDYNGNIPNGSAVQVPGPAYLKCLHQLPNREYLTLMMWFKVPVSGGTNFLLETDNPDNPIAPELRIAGKKICLPGAASGHAPDNNYLVGNETWHQLFYVAEKETFWIYIDGIMSYRLTDPSNRFKFNKDAVSFFGGPSENNSIEVAEIRLWDMPMTMDEIYNQMGLGLVPKSQMSVAKYLETLSPAVGNPQNMYNNSILDGAPWIGRYPSDSSVTNFDDTHKYLFKEDQETYAVLDLGATHKIKEISFTIRPWGGSNLKTIKFYIGDSYADKSSMTDALTFQRSTASGSSTGVVYCARLPQAISGRYVMLDVTEIYNHNFNVAEVSFIEEL